MATEIHERFTSVYQTHFDRVAAYLLARSDRTLAQDALERTFEVAWRRIDDIPEDSLPWLLGVARKVLADLRRSRSRSDALIERISVELARKAELPDFADATLDRLNAAEVLRLLSESDREALLLIAWDGLSEKQAAKVLNCTRGALAVRLYRARGRLRDALMRQESSIPHPAVPIAGNGQSPETTELPIRHQVEESL